MPQVGKRKFPYTSAGVQQAQKHARTTGQKVSMTGYKKGGSKKKYNKGGKVKVKKYHHGGRVSGGMKDKQC
jgi:hypothetical protein